MWSGEYPVTVMDDGLGIFFFSSRRRHTRLQGDWSSDVCSSDLVERLRLGAGVVRVVERGLGLRRRDRDRKSTRLNSSHLVISYAVFCLKKKNRSRTATSPAGVASRPTTRLGRLCRRPACPWCER